MTKASELTEAEMAAKLVKGVEKDMTETANNPTTQALLEERGKTHGDFINHARVTMRLKQVVDDELYACKDAEIQNGGRARVSQHELQNNVMSEALDMILHKIGRIVAGDATVKDHWDDIAGYAKLVADRL